MNYKEQLIQEKLENILNPHKTSLNFKITFQFSPCSHRNFEQALQEAKKNPFFAEEATGNSIRYYASFYPQQAEAAYRLFELVKEFEGITFFINNKRIPYIQDLWLFLFWFYRIA